MQGTIAVAAPILLLWIVQFTTPADSQRSRAPKVNCTGAFEKVEECAIGASYSFLHNGYEHPTNDQELTSRCIKSTDSLACLKHYARCYDPIVREAMLSFVRGRMVRVNALCKNPNSDSSRDTLEAFKCLRQHKLKQGTYYESNLLKRLDAVSSNNLTFEQRLRVACCTVLDFKDQFDRVLAPQCADRFAARVEEDILSYIGELFPLLCQKYGDSKLKPNKECLKLPDLTFAKNVKAQSLGSAIVAIGATISRQ